MNRHLDVDSLLDEALSLSTRSGGTRALGRLLTIVERGGPPADLIADRIHTRSNGAHIVGITGAPGAGKSTLVGRLVAAWTDAGRRPAVIAVDPSSPLSGGAILGDRVRMDDVIGATGFIRSMATRGHHGGLALAVPGAVRLLDAAGYDPVIIETVGVGQVEVDVTATADTTVVVVAPGWGDAVQANKAGLLELADLFVVNKADRPGASDTRRDLELMLDLSHVSGQDRRSGRSRRPDIVMTTATAGAGAPEVIAAIDVHARSLSELDGRAATRERRLRAEVRARVMWRLELAVDQELAARPTLDTARSPTSIAGEIVVAVTEPRP